MPTTEEERLVFENTVESMFLKGLRTTSTPALRNRLKPLGVDLDAKLKPAYPLSAWKQWLRATAEELYPHQPRDHAYRDLGRKFIASYFETTLGKAVVPLLRLVGARRSFLRMAQNFRGGNNFTETKAEILGPAHVRFWINDVFCESPAWLVGLFEYGIEDVHRTKANVVVTEASQLPAGTFDISWDDH